MARKKTLWLLVLIFVSLFALAPYIIVINSIPRTSPINEDEMNELRDLVDVTRLSHNSGSISHDVIHYFAGKDIGDWKDAGKIEAPRIILSKMYMNVDIEEINNYLISIEPWGLPGSSWGFVNGDYDFSLVTLTTVLYLFGDNPDILYPDTLEHLIEVLLVLDGGIPSTKVPRTLGRIFDTENHILMMESSRYLKNLWVSKNISDNPYFDNMKNGLNNWMLEYLNDLRLNGFYEFNSVPYQGYSIQALLNLEAFAEEEVSVMARHLLDNMFLQKSLTSKDCIHNAPFRRQFAYSSNTSLRLNIAVEMMCSWISKKDNLNPNDLREHHLLLASIMPYRPPAQVVENIKNDSKHFLFFGHGKGSSPEIHYRESGFLLSSGGTSRGLLSRIVVRPTVLILSDAEDNIRNNLNLSGRNIYSNNTCVYVRFACSDAPAYVPENFNLLLKRMGWEIYMTPTGFLLAIYNKHDLGIVVLFPELDKDDATDLFHDIKINNPESSDLYRVFRWPNGEIVEYDTKSPGGYWSIKKVNGVPTKRNFDLWPLFNYER